MLNHGSTATSFTTGSTSTPSVSAANHAASSCSESGTSSSSTAVTVKMPPSWCVMIRLLHKDSYGEPGSLLRSYQAQ